MSRISIVRPAFFFAIAFSAGCTVQTTSSNHNNASNTDTCTVDSSVTGCVGSTGYSCTGGSSPDQLNAALVCSDGVVVGNWVDYCCLPTSYSFAGCSEDTSVNCSNNAGPVYGFSCTGSGSPSDTDPTLTCSANVGSGTFCCYAGASAASCAPDASVPGCTGGSAGYSCTGSITPDQTDASLICSDGIVAAGVVEYCCLSPQYTFSTCTVDNNVDCSQNAPPVQGFSCAGSDTPDQSDPNLICSADQGTGLFCCTF